MAEAEPLPNGKYFYLIGKESGLCLEIQDANLEPGNLVVLGEKKDIRDQPEASLSQMWYCCLPSRTIRSRANANLAFTLNEDDQLCVDLVPTSERGDYIPMERQRWLFDKNVGFIRALIDGREMFMEVADHGTDPGTPIVAYDENGEDNQIFIAEHLPAQYFALISAMSDDDVTLAMEISVGLMGKMKEKQDLVISKFDGKDNQIFWEDEMGNLRLKNADLGLAAERELDYEVETASFRENRETQQWAMLPSGVIVNRTQPQFAFDVARAKKKDGTKIIVYNCAPKPNRIWTKKYDLPVKKKKQKKSKKSKKKKKKERESEESESDDDDDSDDED